MNDRLGWQVPWRAFAPTGAAGGGVAAVSRFAEHLDVFWVRPDGGITIQRGTVTGCMRGSTRRRVWPARSERLDRAP